LQQLLKAAGLGQRLLNLGAGTVNSHAARLQQWPQHRVGVVALMPGQVLLGGLHLVQKLA
jgi:hypothetical protein